MVSEKGPIYLSQNRKATGGLPRVPYDRILYGDTLANTLDNDAALYTSPEVCEQEPQFPLGASGQVVQSMPLEMMVEMRVYGPAHSKAVRRAHDLLYDEIHENDYNNVYASRDVAHNLIRDEITFMPALEENIHIPEQVDRRQGRQRKKLVGKILDESKIFDDGHLSVREQLCDRLVKVDINGRIVEVPPSKPPPPAFFSKNKKDETELDQTLNTQLRDALDNFADLYREKSPNKTNKRSKDLMNVTEWKGYRRRHKMMLVSLPQRIKKKFHAIIGHDGDIDDSEDQILDDDHPNMRLCQSIDHLYALAIQDALKEGANVNFSLNGRSPIQSVFARLCKIDSGDELDSNVSGFENVADILAGWGCELNTVDCEIEWNGWAPIHYAAYYGDLKRVEWLIRCGASVHTKTTDGYTTLMLASEKGKFRHVYFLVKNGADFREKDPLGRTILHYAAAGGNLNVVKLLVQCGCVSDKLKLCHQGESPLSISARVNEACFDYLSKIAIPKQLASPYINKLLSSQSYNPLSRNFKNGARLLKRGYMKRKTKGLIKSNLG